MVPTHSIAALHTLDRGHLHLFIAGPGEGEAIAVALPQAGWIFVDACRVGIQLPLEQVYSSLKRTDIADPAVAAVLTHPHDDHADGFAELIEAVKPEMVFVTGNDPPARNLVDAVEVATAAAAVGRAATTRARQIARTVRQAAGAIRQWEADAAKQVAPIRDGAMIYANAPVLVQCRAPDAASIASMLDPDADKLRLAERANWLSAVLEVQFGGTMLVLGGDLPTRDSRSNAPLPASMGWNAVTRNHPHVGAHAGLKAPHHVSRHAFHGGLHTAHHGPERIWLATPYNRSGLPRIEPGEGLEQLLALESSVHLTSEPAAWEQQHAWADPARVTIADLRAVAVAPLHADPIVARGHATVPAVEPAPEDPLWCIAWDDASNIVGRWRGSRAFEVTS